MAPAGVHYGTSEALSEQRGHHAGMPRFAANPVRFKGVAPKPPAIPIAAWINPPKKELTPAEPIKRSCSLIS